MPKKAKKTKFVPFVGNLGQGIVDIERRQRERVGQVMLDTVENTARHAAAGQRRLNSNAQRMVSDPLDVARSVRSDAGKVLKKMDSDLRREGTAAGEEAWIHAQRIAGDAVAPAVVRLAPKSGSVEIIKVGDQQTEDSIIYVNGIDTKRDEAIVNAKTLSEIAGGRTVELIHNRTTGYKLTDAAHAHQLQTHQDYFLRSEEGKLLIQRLKEQPTDKPLAIHGHSGGNIYINNALLALKAQGHPTEHFHWTATGLSLHQRELVKLPKGHLRIVCDKEDPVPKVAGGRNRVTDGIPKYDMKKHSCTYYLEKLRNEYPAYIAGIYKDKSIEGSHSTDSKNSILQTQPTTSTNNQTQTREAFEKLNQVRDEQKKAREEEEKKKQKDAELNEGDDGALFGLIIAGIITVAVAIAAYKYNEKKKKTIDDLRVADNFQRSSALVVAALHYEKCLYQLYQEHYKKEPMYQMLNPLYAPYQPYKKVHDSLVWAVGWCSDDAVGFVKNSNRAVVSPEILILDYPLDVPVFAKYIAQCGDSLMQDVKPFLGIHNTEVIEKLKNAEQALRSVLNIYNAQNISSVDLNVILEAIRVTRLAKNMSDEMYRKASRIQALNVYYAPTKFYNDLIEILRQSNLRTQQDIAVAVALLNESEVKPFLDKLDFKDVLLASQRIRDLEDTYRQLLTEKAKEVFSHADSEKLKACYDRLIVAFKARDKEKIDIGLLTVTAQTLHIFSTLQRLSELANANSTGFSKLFNQGKYDGIYSSLKGILGGDLFSAGCLSWPVEEYREYKELHHLNNSRKSVEDWLIEKHAHQVNDVGRKLVTVQANIISLRPSNEKDSHIVRLFNALEESFKKVNAMTLAEIESVSLRKK